MSNSLSATGHTWTDTSNINGITYNRYVFTDTSNSTKNIQINGYSPTVYYYIVGGGGGGGGGITFPIGGKAGAGSSIVANNFIATAGIYNITVGDGGLGGSGANASDGVSSSFHTFTASGGLSNTISTSSKGNITTDIFGNSYYSGSSGGGGAGNYGNNYGGGGVSTNGTVGIYAGGVGGSPNGGGSGSYGFRAPAGNGGNGGIGGGGGGGGGAEGSNGIAGNGGNGGIGGGGGGGGSKQGFGSGNGGNGGFGNTTNYKIIGGGAGGGGGSSFGGGLSATIGGNGSQGFVVVIVALDISPPTNVIATQLSYPAQSPAIINWSASPRGNVFYKITTTPSTVTNTTALNVTNTSFDFSTLRKGSYIFNVIAVDSISSSLPALSNTLNVTCFKEGTKILTDKGYVAIENLREGDLVQTIRNGYKPITIISKQEINHNALQERIKDQLYVCSNIEYSELFEDLVITGGHSVLIDEFKECEKEKVLGLFENIYVTEGKYRLPVFLDERSKIYDIPGKYCVYHFSLEHEFKHKNYGVYANGLLVECCSEEYIKDFTKMEIIK